MILTWVGTKTRRPRFEDSFFLFFGGVVSNILWAPVHFQGVEASEQGCALTPSCLLPTLEYVALTLMFPERGGRNQLQLGNTLAMSGLEGRGEQGKTVGIRGAVGLDNCSGFPRLARCIAPTFALSPQPQRALQGQHCWSSLGYPPSH